MGFPVWEFSLLVLNWVCVSRHLLVLLGAGYIRITVYPHYSAAGLRGLNPCSHSKYLLSHLSYSVGMFLL